MTSAPQQQRQSHKPRISPWFETLGKGVGYIVAAILAIGTILIVFLFVAKPVLMLWNWLDVDASNSLLWLEAAWATRT